MLVYMGLIRGIDFFAFTIFHARSVGEFYSYEPFEPTVSRMALVCNLICIQNPNVWPFKWKLLNSTSLCYSSDKATLYSSSEHEYFTKRH